MRYRPFDLEDLRLIADAPRKWQPAHQQTWGCCWFSLRDAAVAAREPDSRTQTWVAGLIKQAMSAYRQESMQPPWDDEYARIVAVTDAPDGPLPGVSCEEVMVAYFGRHGRSRRKDVQVAIRDRGFKDRTFNDLMDRLVAGDLIERKDYGIYDITHKGKARYRQVLEAASAKAAL